MRRPQSKAGAKPDLKKKPAPPPSRPAAKAKKASDRPPEVDEMVDSLFKLSDKDNSGTIEFREFMDHHRNIMSASDLGGAAEINESNLEKQFREHDEDNSQTLDLAEFRTYMCSVFAMLGKRKFLDVGAAIIEEVSKSLDAKKNSFDRNASERLLEKVRAAHWMLPDIVHSAIALLDKQADPNVRDDTGAHCLFYAVEKCEDDFVELLLERRANPMIHNKDRDCSAFRAARCRKIDTLKRLLALEATPASTRQDTLEVRKANEDLVRNMAEHDGASVLALFKKSVDVNFRDSSGWTPLTAAVFWGREDVVELLLKASHKNGGRANLDARNGKGRPPLHIAARKGRENILGSLIRGRCDLDTQDADGWTALHHAVFNAENDCIVQLLEGGADTQIQGHHGLTAYMLTTLPSTSGNLKEQVVKMLEPPERINFHKAIMPILKSDLNVFDKLDALYNLPGVHNIAKNLRMYEQLFNCRTGPNKVRLQQLWSSLAKPIIERLLTGDIDLEPLPANPTEDQITERARDEDFRRREQRAFLKQWLLDTKGPRRSDTWEHDNRESYWDDMHETIEKELARFREALDNTFEAMLQKHRGDALADRPCFEEMNSKFKSQLQAHPMPIWLQDMDPAGTFEALRIVGAAGMGTASDDTAVLKLVDLLTTSEDFDRGKVFWSNVYALWLSAYARMAQPTFAKKMTELIDKFNEENKKDPALHAELRLVPPKTYDQIRAKAATFERQAEGTYRHRTMAAGVLDIVRCSITVKEPKCVLMLLDHLFEPLTIVQNRLECLRVVNMYSKAYSPDELMGYRRVEVNFLLDAGVQPSACGRQGRAPHVKVIGEVQIILEDFLAFRRQRHLLFKCARGEFDWRKEGEAEATLGRRTTKAMDSITGDDADEEDG